MIEAAASALRDGQLVALPTETVYGLGADAGNSAAVRRIFEVKGRPATNPLIVHVADADAAKRCVADWPEAAQRLAERFWPGPLTIVLPKGQDIADEVTAGGPTVAVRVPNHPLTLDVLRAFHALGGLGVAAPSANRSEHVSPTTAQHVRDDLGDRVDLILDGGPCGVGIESTVIRLSNDEPEVLRLGGVSVEQLRSVLPTLRVRGHETDAGPAASPGRSHRHYAPNMHVIGFDPRAADWAKELLAVALEEGWANLVFLVLRSDKAATAIRNWSNGKAKLIEMPPEPTAYAAGLYAALRRAETLGAETDLNYLFVEMPPDEPQWAAVRDRLTRACAGG